MTAAGRATRLEAARDGAPVVHPYGAMFAEARVNAVTGEVRINRFLGSFDCGTILNPKTTVSQFRGGIMGSASL